MISSISRKSRALLGKPMIALALALGGVAGMAASPAVQAQEEQPELKPSNDFRKAIAPVIEAFRATQANADLQARAQEVRGAEGAAREQGRAELRQTLAEDLALLRAAKDKIDNQSDRYYWGQFAINYGVLTDNPDLQLEGIVEETASGLQTSTRKAQLSNARAMIHFDREEYAQARTAFQTALDAGATDANLRNNIVVTYIREGDRAGALAYLNEMIEEQAAVGTPDEQMLLRAYSIARELEVPNANDYAFELVRFYPTQKNWANAIILVRDDPSLSDEAVLDLQRLMVLTDSVQNRYDLTTLISLADTRKRPQEVLEAIELGLQSGLLEANDPIITEARTEANRQVQEDETELVALDRDARAASAAAITPTVAGDAFLNYDQPAKAEELYRIALDKQGADVPMLMTRIGIAQLEQGKFQEAQATFAEVTGARASVANLWRIYVLQQGG
jgi:Flp pilus assembly protein TadD